VILGLDTATADTAVAVLDGDRVRHEARVGPAGDDRPEPGRVLLGLVDAAVTEVGGWEAIELIAAGVGPGSFTGIRVGLSTARGLAQARRLPTVGVATTATLAAGLRSLEEASDRPVVGVVDARRGEVFASVDRGAGPSGPVVSAPGDLATALGADLADAFAGGEGAVRFRAEIEATGIEVCPDGDPANHVSASWICRLAAGAPRSDRTGPGDLTPIYMRRPDAERWIDRDHSRDGTDGTTGN